MNPPSPKLGGVLGNRWLISAGFASAGQFQGFGVPFQKAKEKWVRLVTYQDDDS